MLAATWFTAMVFTVYRQIIFWNVWVVEGNPRFPYSRRSTIRLIVKSVPIHRIIPICHFSIRFVVRGVSCCHEKPLEKLQGHFSAFSRLILLRAASAALLTEAFESLLAITSSFGIALAA